MSIPHSCPSCGHFSSIPDDQAGTELRCPSCGTPFMVPARAALPASKPCPICGAEMPGDAQFCGSCGASADQSMAAVDLAKRPPVVTLLAVLNGLAAALALLVGVVTLFLAIGAESDQAMAWGFAVAYLLIGSLHTACAVGLWKLAPWGRSLQIGLAVIGLLGIPIGTVIAILILVYLFRPEIKLLFSGRPLESMTAQERVVLAKAKGSSAMVVAIVAVLVLAVPMCGIIAAIAVPNFTNAVNRGRQKRSMADMRSIGTAIEAYAVDHRHYPVAIDSVDELDGIISPVYLPEVPRVDGWSNEFVIATAADGSGYEIISLGRDGRPGDRPGGTTTDMDCDIVYSDGYFQQYPEGVQY
jgi:general secretion pathway protein G